MPPPPCPTPPQRSWTSAATCCASTPPTPVTTTPAPASAAPPSTWRRSSPRWAWSPSCTSPRRAGRTWWPASRAPTRAGARCWCTATWTWCPPTPTSGRCDPFSGELRDGYLWGRGAIDMKDFDAMVLAVVRHWQRTGVRPPRDIVLAFTADEEAGSDYGAHFLVDNHRGPLRRLHRGDRRGRRLLLLGQRQPAALPHRDRREGHRLAAAARQGPPRARLDDARRQRGHRARRGGRPDRPAPLPGGGHRHRAGVPRRRSPTCSASSWTRTTRRRPSPSSARSPTSSARPSATPPTRPGLRAGYKDNVIPGRATATIDCRSLPGQSELLERQLRELVGPDIAIEYIQRQPRAGDHLRR